MVLREVRDTSKGAAAHDGDPLHTFPVKAGESITLSKRPGVRFVWRRK